LFVLFFMFLLQKGIRKKVILKYDVYLYILEVEGTLIDVREESWLS
jgi:hypothetical protein